MPIINEITVDGNVNVDQNASGSITTNPSISKSIKPGIDITGQIGNAASVEGSFNVGAIVGTLSNKTGVNGNIRSNSDISGEGHLPFIYDSTAIHYGSTQYWNDQVYLVAEEGHLYVYSDHEQKELPDGSIIDVPGIKVGDGNAYLIDLPFVTSGANDEFEDHIRNKVVHITAEERAYWNNKVASEVNPVNEELILYI